MRATVAIVNWNGAEQLGACLDAWLAQELGDGLTAVDVLVVDNASHDGSRALLEQRVAEDASGRLRVLHNATNRGFAGAANDGIAATDADVVVTSNFDVAPAPDYLRRAVAALAADPRRGAVQGKLLRTVNSPDGHPIIDTTGHVAFTTRLFRNRGEGQVDRGQWDEPGEVFGVSGAIAVYRRAALLDLAVDGEVFDEDLFAFWEDVDLDWRAAMRGWVTWYEPAAVAYHERGGAGPRRTARVEQLNFQNRLLTLVKNDGLRAIGTGLPGLLLTTLLKTAELIVTVPSAFFASFSGLRLLPRMVRKRRAIQARSTVSSAEVVARWFEPFAYGAWIRTWWRRVRGVPLGRD